MGKELTIKQVANRMKAKGLQKLRWYCQMCQKQCRDENGFKCHCMSEGHLRMMKVYAENPHSFSDEFSREFEHGFMDIVKRRWKTKRVFANKAYNEFIQDKHHMHMNATKWHSLSEFVLHLGRTNQCEIEETPKGWYIKYIDKDPEALARKEALAKKEKMEASDEVKVQRRIEAQMAATAAMTEDEEGSQEEEAEVKKEDEEEPKALTEAEIKAQLESRPVVLSLSAPAQPKKVLPVASVFDTKPMEVVPENDKKRKREEFETPTNIPATANTSHLAAFAPEATASVPQPKKAKLSALDEIKIKEEEKKDKQSRKDYWLHPGIVVKILNKHVGDGKFYKQKAVVLKVEDLYRGVIKLVDAGTKLIIDQRDLETVLPNKGGRVLVVNGAYRGEQAILQDIDVQHFTAKVTIETGVHRGTVLEKTYEDICKYAPE